MLVWLNYQPTFDTYNSIWSQIASYILEYFSRFPSVFSTNITCSFHISFTPPLPNQISRPFCVVCSNRLSKFQLFSKSTRWSPLSTVSLTNYLHIYWTTINNTTHISKCSHSCHVRAIVNNFSPTYSPMYWDCIDSVVGKRGLFMRQFTSLFL